MYDSLLNVGESSVEELNKALVDGLSSLKIQTNKRRINHKKIAEISSGLNDILFNTIDDYVPDVIAVNVQTNLDLSKNSIRAPDKGFRDRLRRYIQKVTEQENLEGEVPFSFTLHLPFPAHKGEFGYGCRSSSETVAFESYKYRRFVPSALKIDLGLGGSSYEKIVRLLLGETESVSLAQVKDSEFSPIYKGWDKPLKPPRSPLLNYLIFRRFERRRINPKKIPQSKWKEKIISQKGIMFPNNQTNLLILSREGKSSGLTGVKMSGFTAVIRGKKEKLYEFSWLELPRDLLQSLSGNYLALAAYAIAIHQETPQPSINVYEGNEAIKRLSQNRPKEGSAYWH